MYYDVSDKCRWFDFCLPEQLNWDNWAENDNFRYLDGQITHIGFLDLTK